MSRRLFLATLSIGCALGVTVAVHAQPAPRPSSGQAARPATIAKPPAPAADLGSLAAAIREEPSPAITSIKGAGTATAAAEARMTQKILTEFCSANAQHYQSAKQCADTFGNKTYRATADCTAGRITTTAELTYTLDGVWGKDTDGAGQTRWRDDSGSIVPP